VDGLEPRHAFAPPDLAGGLDVRRLSGPADLDAARPFLGTLADPAASPFTALNSAFWSEAILVRIPAGLKAPIPVHLLFLSAGGATPRVGSPRVLVVAEEDSEVSVVESYVGLGPGVRLTNAVTEIVVGRGARVDHYRLQREDRGAYHVGALAARVGRDGRFRSTAVSVGGAISRVDLHVELAGEGAEGILHGLYEATGTQVVDHHTTIDHAVPHGTSRELYKGILDGHARAVFHGRVNVRAGAQKTDAIQANTNLLLSEGALVHSTPQLEILANDVKCKHGATVGQLDRDVLFYLRSRGIGEAQARRLLIHAFAGEIADRIPVEAVRAQLGGCLVTMAGGEAGREYAV
jgi:Fe-S cluster assembly protein SufD